MRKYSDIVLSASNNVGNLASPVSGAQVLVLGHASQTNATIYSDDGVTTTVNPVITDAQGRYQFYVANGRYDLRISAAGFTTFTLSDIDIHDETDTTVPGETPLAGNLIFTGINSHSGAETFTGPANLNAGGSLTGTFTGTHTLSGSVNLSGGGSLAGTFTGGSTLNVNGSCFVTATQSVQQCINSFASGGYIYDWGGAQTALGSIACNKNVHIYLSSVFSYTIGTSGSANDGITVTKPCAIEGLGGDNTNIQYIGTGKAVNVNLTTQPNAPGGFILEHVRLFGPGQATATTGLTMGNASQNSQIVIRESQIDSFGTGLNLATAAAGFFRCEKSSITSNNQNLLIPSGGGGENMTFNNCLLGSSTSGWANNIELDSTFTTYFNNCSLDFGQIKVTAGGVVINSSHIENSGSAGAGNAGANPRLLQTGGNVFLTNVDTFEDNAVAANWASVSAGTLQVDGGWYQTPATSTALFAMTGSGQLSIAKQPTQTGYTNLITLAGSATVPALITGNQILGYTVANGTQTYTLPPTGDTFAVLGATQTLTNKTLTAPAISTPAFSGTATGSLTNLALTTPVLSGLTNGSGLQLFNTTTTCTTAATAGAQCTTALITLPVAYTDTNYRLVCSGLTPTGVPVISNPTKSSATQFTLTITAITAVAASYGSFDCTTSHN